MIWIYRDDGSHAFCCSDCETFFRHIMDIENAKLLEGYPQFGQSTWSFTHYPRRRVVDLYIHTPPLLRSTCLTQAFERSLGLIKIYQGDIARPVEILATDELDINALKKQWCLDYCKAHHYQVFEDPPHLPLPFSFWGPKSKGPERGALIEASLPSRTANDLSSAHPAGYQEKIHLKGFT